MQSFEQRLNDYREKTYWPEYDKHVSDRIKALYPSIPSDAKPEEVISRYKSAFAPDMPDSDFFAKLNETHAKNFEPSVTAPEPNMLDTAQAAATPENLTEMGKGVAQFGGGQVLAHMGEKTAGQLATKLPAWMTRGATVAATAAKSIARIGGQAAMLIPTAEKLIAAQMGGNAMEKTAQAMPEPNITALQTKGYTPAQIANVVNGYTKVQNELYGEEQKFGQEGVSASAEGIANAALFGFGGGQIEKGITRVMGGKALAGVAPAVKSIVGGTVAHGATGAVLGGGFGATQGATEAMAKAKAAGLGANDIFTAGTQGAWQVGKTGAIIGGIVGGLIGAPAATFTTVKDMVKGASTLRQAMAAAHLEDAQRININNFADRFKANELPERFPEDLAANAGNDAGLAQSVVAGVWGPEVEATEHGQQAASRIYEKILAWRGARKKLMGNMIDLPATPVETPGASITPTLTPEQQAMGLQPTAQTEGAPGLVAPAPGLLPAGAGRTPAPGGQAPQPNVIGEFKPTPEMQPTAPPQGVAQMPGVQPVGAEVPAPPATPLTLQSVQPAAPAATAPRLGPPLGPVEQGGRPAPPAPEINPKLPEKIVKAIVTVDGEPFTGRTHAEALQAAMEAGKLTPEMIQNEKAGAGKVNADLFLTDKGNIIDRAQAEAMHGASDAVDLGLTKAPEAPVATAAPTPGSAPEPNPVHIPTHAESAIAALGPNEHVTLGTDPAGKHLTIEKLGVTAGTLAKPGASSDALAHVNAIADEHGLPVESHITPQAGPRGGKIPLEKLLPWYEQHGYKVTSQGDGWATVYRAPSEPAIAERIKDLTPEQQKLAAGNVTLGQPMAHAEFGERLGSFLDKQAEAARARIKARGTRLMMGVDPADLADHSIVLAAEMFSKGMRTKAAVANWLVETYGESIRPHIAALYDKAKLRLTNMFKTEARATTKLKELVGLRDAGTHGMDWYEETANWVHKTFGPEDSDMFMRFLALTSADSSTEGGAALAMKAFAQWKGGLPFDGMRGPHMVKMLDEAVRGENFGGDKIQSFYQALKGDENAVVLDRWMIRALGLPMKKGSLGMNDYKLYSQIVRNLAGDAKMSPRQLQAAIWEGARVGDAHKRWKTGGPSAVAKIGSARPLEQLLQREFGGQTPYQWVENNHIKHEDLANMSAGMRAARENGGYSFDPQTWKTDVTPGYVVTLASDVVPRQEFYPSTLTKFKNQFSRLLSESAFGGPHVNIGVFNLGDYKPGHFSMDLNMVIPADKPGALEMAKQIGMKNRQFEIGEIDPNGEYVQGHKTGYNPKKHGPQFTPPAEGPERRAWFKAAQARARTLLDQADFTLKPKEK